MLAAAFPAVPVRAAQPRSPACSLFQTFPGQRRDDDDARTSVRVWRVSTLLLAAARHRAARSTAPVRSATPPSARTTTSRRRSRSGFPTGKSRLQRIARHHRHDDRRGHGSRLREREVPRLPGRAAALEEVQVPVRLHAHQVRGGDRPHADDRLQRAAYTVGLPVNCRRSSGRPVASASSSTSSIATAGIFGFITRSQVHRRARSSSLSPITSEFTTARRRFPPSASSAASTWRRTSRSRASSRGSRSRY